MTKENRAGPWLIAFRVIFTIALAGSIIFIFHNSLQNGAESSARSQAVLHYFNAVLRRVGATEVSEHFVRKLAHFCEYCLEGFWLMLCLRVYTVRFVRHISWPLLGGLLTALTDETIQILSLGRSSQVTDVWIDFAGVVAGLFAALLILLLARGVQSVHRIEQENRRLRSEREAYLAREHTHINRRQQAGPDTREKGEEPQ
jgi:VanZ family protein